VRLTNINKRLLTYLRTYDKTIILPKYAQENLAEPLDRYSCYIRCFSDLKQRCKNTEGM